MIFKEENMWTAFYAAITSGGSNVHWNLNELKMDFDKKLCINISGEFSINKITQDCTLSRINK